MLMSCDLCLTARIANYQQGKDFEILLCADNQERLLRLMKEFTETYGIPPSAWRLVHLFHESSSDSGGDGKRLRPPEDATDSGRSGKRSRPDQDENAGQGPDQAHELQEKAVSPPKGGIKVEGVGVFKWYSIEHAGGRKHKCLCKGNCNLS